MREILFRGKRVSGDWVYGYLLKMFGELSIMCLDDENNIYPVNEETVGQYTGLTDKNGKKIFEGDILNGMFNFGLPIKSKAVFRSGSFGIESQMCGAIHYNAFPCIWGVTFEVISNIYDNPELLEQK